MRVGIIGFGGVGKAFFRLLGKKKEALLLEGIKIEVVYIIKSNGGIYNPNGIAYDDLTAFLETESDIVQYEQGGSRKVDFEFLMKNQDVDIIIEMTPTNKETGEPAITYIQWALMNKIHVVTANKGPILLAHKKLNQIAVDNNVQLCIGCTTGGALPTINGGLIELAGSNIASIEGVLNGTTNFILQQMEKKEISYDTALKIAQEQGIAETDPTLDVEGWDTGTKLLILVNALMNEDKGLEDVEIEGITTITPAAIVKAKAEEKKYKLIGKAMKENNNIKITVGLEKIEKNHPLFNVDGKNKGITYSSDTLGNLTMIGGASGVEAAAASVLRDLIVLYRGYKFSR